jgi:hypothetical protein
MTNGRSSASDNTDPAVAAPGNGGCERRRGRVSRPVLLGSFIDRPAFVGRALMVESVLPVQGLSAMILNSCLHEDVWTILPFEMLWTDW